MEIVAEAGTLSVTHVPNIHNKIFKSDKERGPSSAASLISCASDPHLTRNKPFGCCGKADRCCWNPTRTPHVAHGMPTVVGNSKILWEHARS